MIVLLCVGILLAVVGFSVFGWAVVDHAASGRLPSWIEALATLTALVAATFAGIYAAGAYQLESQRETRWIETSRRSQASTIGLTVIGEPFERRPLDRIDVVLTNGSAMEIHELDIKIDVNLSTASHPYSANRATTHYAVPSLAAVRATTVPVPLTPDLTFDAYLAMDQPPSLTVKASVEFRDANLVRWLRDENGVLHEVVQG